MSVDPALAENAAMGQHRVWRDTECGLELQRGRHVKTYELISHFHDEYQFMTVENGAREISFGRDRRVFGRNLLIIVNPGVTHSTGCIGEFGSSFRTMHVPVRMLSEAIDGLGVKVGREPLFPVELENLGISRHFSRLHAAYETMVDPLQKEEEMINFVDMLVDQCRFGRGRQRRDGLDNVALHRVRDYIEANFARAITLDELAAVAGTSKFHFIRGFAKSVQMPPHAYHIRVRLKYGKRLLAEGMPIKRVAAATGFVDASHFGRHFLQIVGFTPSSYQRMVVSQAR